MVQRSSCMASMEVERLTLIDVLAVIASPVRVGRLPQLAAFRARSRRSSSFWDLLQRPVGVLARVLPVTARTRLARELRASEETSQRSCNTRAASEASLCAHLDSIDEHPDGVPSSTAASLALLGGVSDSTVFGDETESAAAGTCRTLVSGP